MKTLSYIDQIPENESLSVTIGNFDGVHLGHQKFLENLSLLFATIE